MPLIVRTPYLPSTNAEIAFETYRYYLESICQCIYEYGRWTDFGTAVLAKTESLQRMDSPDLEWIDRFLKIAWNTEFLISFGSTDSNLLRFSNQWTPIQCYYAVYGAAEAASYVIDGSRADGHEKSLRKVTAYLTKNGLPPWNFAFRGPRGRRGQDHRPMNFPEGMVIPHNLSRAGVQPHEMVAKCLKAEHSHRIDERWKSGMGKKYEFDPRPTGVLHFLYRLRVRSNYHDVDTFITNAPPENLQSFGDSIRRLTFFALLYLETIVLRKIGKESFLRLADGYLRTNENARRLKGRRNFFENAP